MKRPFLLTLIFPALLAADQNVLPDTALLEWQGSHEDYSDQLMEGAHAFVERKIVEAAENPPPFPKDRETREARVAELAFRLGAGDERAFPKLEFFTSNSIDFDGNPGTPLIASHADFTVHQVRWPLFENIYAEGLYVNPTSADTGTPIPSMVLMPDAAETPEDILGLTQTIPAEQQIGLRFALAGFRILIPAVVDREVYHEATEQSHREWIYRQAFQMGRHPIGYEVQTIHAAVDWFALQFPTEQITAAGYGSGGRAALYATALDDRIHNGFISGAFGPRTDAWAEPIDHTIFGLLPRFGDASIAAMISPRPLLIEHTEFPEASEISKGSIDTPTIETVEAELAIAGEIEGLAAAPPGILIHEAAKSARGSYPAVAGFLQTIGRSPDIDRMPPLAFLVDSRIGFDPDQRQRRIFHGLESHVQRLVDTSDTLRKEAYFHTVEPQLAPGKWSTEPEHETIIPTDFIVGSTAWRTKLRDEVIGRFDEEFLPINPRSKKLLETAKWTAWDIALNVYPELEAWGVLLLPKDLEPGEKRPVVICQHGRNGLPLRTINEGASGYRDIAARLCEMGYITFSPHNLYRGEDRYRDLDRKANLIGASLFSIITDSNEQILTWLQSRPEVDADRIAYLGQSYGGEAAVRLPALLTGISLAICSGDFNHWTRKVADPDYPKGFMTSIEWEMPYWNMGNTFDYSEMAGLIFPRPFFVERGHYDHVAIDEWAAYEYASVRRLYAQFDYAENTGIDYFHGGHAIRAERSLEFLHRHFDWDVTE